MIRPRRRWAALQNLEAKMTKSETREVAKLAAAARMGMLDMVARGLSALVRASMSKRSRAALMAAAAEHGVIGHPEFIV